MWLIRFTKGFSGLLIIWKGKIKIICYIIYDKMVVIKMENKEMLFGYGKGDICIL